MAEALQVNVDSDTYKKNTLGSTSLVSVFNAGLTGGSVAADSAAPVAAASNDAPGTVEHWNNFVNAEASKGTFSAFHIGSTDYQNALKTLATQYQTKFNLSESPMGSDAISEVDKQRAEILKTEGNQLLAKGDSKNAVAKYTQAILLDPTNHLYWANRAVAQYKMSRFADAAADSKQAIAIEPNYVKAHYRLGQCYAAQRSYTEAIDAYNKAIEVAVATNETSLRAEIQRELDAVKARNKPTVPKATKASAQRGKGGLDLGSLMNNPNVQAMMSNPDLMNSLSSMLGGNGGDMDMSALQNVLGGAMGAGNAPNAENIADLVSQVKDDPAVSALESDPQLAEIMKVS